jgi:hypothetical protein
MFLKLLERGSAVCADARAAREWWHRLKECVPLDDRIALTSSPVLVGKFLSYAISRHKRESEAGDQDARNAEFVRVAMDLFRALGRVYFGLQVRGVDNVPERGPVLIVGNHNGAFFPTDSFFTQLAIWDRFGPSRAVYALAHDFLFFDPQLRRYALELGALRAG